MLLIVKEMTCAICCRLDSDLGFGFGAPLLLLFDLLMSAIGKATYSHNLIRWGALELLDLLLDHLYLHC